MKTITINLNDGTEQIIKDYFKNGKWGRCCVCQGYSDPSKCEFFDRADHNLNRAQLNETLGSDGIE